MTAPGAGSTAQTEVALAASKGWRAPVAGCLLRWHLCSLDAPTIAIFWALLLGRPAHVGLSAAELAVLGLGTWIVYVLDRVLDGTGVAAGSASLRHRHHFHREHRRILLRLCWLAAAALALLCQRLPARLVELYVALGAPVGAYALLVHRRLLWPARADGSRAEVPVPANQGYRKEAAVALLFTAAVAAPASIAAQPECRPALLTAALLLAALCWLNCSLISYIEVSHAEGAGSAADAPARAKQRRWLITCALALAAAAAAASVRSYGWSVRRHAGEIAASTMDPRSADCAAAVLISCLLLVSLLVDRRDAPGAALRTRVLADLGLLSPVLFLLRHA